MHVAMLVQNDWRHDTRVVREARSLAGTGYRVDLITRTNGERHLIVDRDDVTYHEIPHGTLARWRHTTRLLGTHTRVLLLGMGRTVKGPGRMQGLSSGLELLAVPFLGAGLIASALLRRQSHLLFAERERMSFLERLLEPARVRIHRLARWLVQPILYLNDHAANCLDDICALDPDVVHAHDLVTLSAAVMVRRRTGARVVYDSHEIETESNNWSLNALTRHYVARYEATLIREADHVVTVTAGIADWLAEKYGIAKPVVVMNAPLSRTTPASRTLRTALGLEPQVPLVVYVGGVMVDRGLELCVQALPLLPTVHLALVGPRFPDTEATIRDLARQEHVSDRLHLVDPVAPQDVVPFVADADCGVIPIQNVCLSYYYCFPNKLLETVLAKLPVAVANLLELARFVRETGVGVVMDERDPVSIAAALTELLEHPDRYAVTPAILADVLERYGWPVQERRLVDLYRALAQRADAALENREPDRSLVEAGGP